ncbi:MAG: LL-diaminopimelate aminotransferase [Candidatus Micrarchaeota archaeon]
MNIEYANRVNKIPPYLFAELEQIVEKKQRAGIDVINLGIGDPDLPTPQFIREVLAREAMNTDTHNYSSSAGELEFRQAVAQWYKKRFNVNLDATTQVCNLIGSKEGIANIARAFVNPGDTALIPDPAYTVYQNGATLLCDGNITTMPLLAENNFLPILENIPKAAVQRAKIMYLNYPNNPIGAIADKKFLKTVVDFCLENNIILCYDNAYSEFTFDNFVAPSIFEIPDAMQCAVEFNSLSKTFCMTGDRCGFAVGNEKIIAGLKKIKSNLDSGLPVYIQRAGIAALGAYTNRSRPPIVEQIMKEYEHRRDSITSALNEIGINAKKPPATFYMWVKVEGNCVEFARKALEQNVVITPGTGFGKHGEGYVRFALTQNSQRLREAVERINKAIHT